MNQFKFAALAFLLMSLGGMHTAAALSTEQGTSTPGAFVNLADPDEQMPDFLRPPGSQQPSAAEGFDSSPVGQGFVNQDIIKQSTARGSGSYIQPDQQK